MTEPYLGEIQLFAFNFAPVGWALCNGATLQIRQFTALFSLIGTAYGGDGQNTFSLPNLVARAPCSQGTGPGLTQRSIGETFGEIGVTLTQPSIPSHIHSLNVFNQPDTTKRSASPAPNYALIPPENVDSFVNGLTPNTSFAPITVGVTGGGQPHENRQPYLALNYCIALQGTFPSFG